MNQQYLSWGRNRRYTHEVFRPAWMAELHLEAIQAKPDATVLAYGLGRSYGDACLNANGYLIDTSSLRRMVRFDAATGVLECEAGVSLAEIIEVFLPRGWFPPVVPGTKYVTVGGAVAHDIHGKNHHRRGSFGNHVLGLELLRSDGKKYNCSPQTDSALFAATIGGMGLTGLITKVKLQLMPVTSPLIDCVYTRMNHIDEYEALVAAADQNTEYTVAWIDSTAPLSQLGRGIFMTGNHASGSKDELSRYNAHRAPLVNFPIETPVSLINEYTTRYLNSAYFHRLRHPIKKSIADFDGYFFPLDKIGRWNFAFGKAGFYQYQFVVPQSAFGVIKDVLKIISDRELGSFVTVLKTFGPQTSAGMMSFPLQGPTLTLDIPDIGSRALKLFDELDVVVEAAGGRIYTAKDARMSAAFFAKSYPRKGEFEKQIDPKFSSSLWRRLNE